MFAEERRHFKEDYDLLSVDSVLLSHVTHLSEKRRDGMNSDPLLWMKKTRLGEARDLPGPLGLSEAQQGLSSVWAASRQSGSGPLCSQPSTLGFLGPGALPAAQVTWDPLGGPTPVLQASSRHDAPQRRGGLP